MLTFVSCSFLLCPGGPMLLLFIMNCMYLMLEWIFNCLHERRIGCKRLGILHFCLTPALLVKKLYWTFFNRKEFLHKVKIFILWLYSVAKGQVGGWTGLSSDKEIRIIRSLKRHRNTGDMTFKVNDKWGINVMWPGTCDQVDSWKMMIFWI